MTSNETINFSATDERTDWNVTSAEAARLVCRYLWVIAKNTWRAIDAFAHNWPWVLITAILTASLSLSVYHIGDARAERDKASRQVYELQKQVKQLTIAKEVAR